MYERLSLSKQKELKYLSFKNIQNDQNEIKNNRYAIVSKIDINELNGDMLIDAMGRDKKRIGKGLVLILPGTNLDMLRIDDLQNSEIFYAVDYLKKLYRNKMVKDTNDTH